VTLFGDDELHLPKPDVGGRLSPDGAHLPVLEPTGDIANLLTKGTEIQAQATLRGIHNVFDDGGYKELVMLSLFNLRKLHREGDDAEDAEGRRYEMKTVARVSSSGERKTNLSVTTEHTLTQANIDRYRATFLWIVAVFDRSRPEVIYEIPPVKLERYFAAWEAKLASQGQPTGGAPNHMNNPKIPLKWIMAHGIQVWPRNGHTYNDGVR
jgi:Restriction endonuclease PvuII